MLLALPWSLLFVGTGGDDTAVAVMLLALGITANMALLWWVLGTLRRRFASPH